MHSLCARSENEEYPPLTLSLPLTRPALARPSGNEDEEYLRQDVDYRPVSFLITTGPGPAPDLDEENIVFGTVLGELGGCCVSWVGAA